MHEELRPGRWTVRFFAPPAPGTHYGLDVYRVEDESHGPWEEMAYSFGAAAAFGLMAMAEAIRARTPTSLVDEVLDAVEAVVEDDEIDLSDVTSPAAAKRAQLELIAHIRDQLCVDPPAAERRSTDR